MQLSVSLVALAVETMDLRAANVCVRVSQPNTVW